MKIENLSRAVELSNQLNKITKAVEEASKMKKAVNSERGCGISITEHSDGSGEFDIPYVYDDGNFNPKLYNTVANAILSALEEKKEEIELEIRTL